MPGLHKVYFHCHAPSEEGLDDSAITVKGLEEVCLRPGGKALLEGSDSAKIIKRLIHQLNIGESTY